MPSTLSAPGRILGVHEDAKPAATTSRYPAALWGREFVAGRDGVPLPESTTASQLTGAVLAKVQPHTSTGGGCVLSLKAPMAAVARGKWDARLGAVAKALEGLAVIVLLWHEPEDDLKASVFVPGHNRGRQVLQQQNPGLEVGYAGMAYQWRPGSKTTGDAVAWAGDLQADLYLADVYSGVSFPATAILPEHTGWVRWYAEMVAAHPGRRWGVAERGILAGPTRVATIAREAAWLASDPIGQKCEMYLWWSTGGQEGNPGWVLDAAGEAAVSQLLSRLTVPAGFHPHPVLEGVLVCQARGCLVSAELAALHTH